METLTLYKNPILIVVDEIEGKPTIEIKNRTIKQITTIEFGQKALSDLVNTRIIFDLIGSKSIKLKKQKKLYNSCSLKKNMIPVSNEDLELLSKNRQQGIQKIFSVNLLITN